MNITTRTWMGLAVAAVTIGLAAPVQAQTEEIVVTARRFVLANGIQARVPDLRQLGVRASCRF